MDQGLYPGLLRPLRILCAGCALSSFALAGHILFAPDAFFAACGVGGGPFAQALYGGALSAWVVVRAR